MFGSRKNALAFLGLPPGATFENAKKAYKKMSLRMHPNKGGSDENFQRLGAAFAMIKHGTNRTQWVPTNGPIPKPNQPRPQPRPQPQPQRPTVRVVVTGIPGPLENTSKDIVFLPGSFPTLGMVLGRIQQEIPAFAEYLKNGLRAYRAVMYVNGSVVKSSINHHDMLAPLLGTGLSGTTVFVMLEARKPTQSKSGWMFLGENANAYRRRSTAEAEERKRRKNAKRNADAAKARANAGNNANGGGGEYEVRVWTIKNMGGAGPSRFPFSIKKMTFGSRPTVMQVIERVAGGSDMIRRMAEKGYLAFDKPYTWRPSNSRTDPIKDLKKTLAPTSFHLIVRDREDKNTYGLSWKKLAFDANAEARARARERFGANARANANANANARAKANANAAAKARANANAAAAKARANANAAAAAAKARANANAAAAAAKARANANAAAAAAKARANANAAAAAAKARANANAAKARAKANAAASRANARARANAEARHRAANEANARARANANIIEVDFWDGVSIRPTSGARFAFPAGTRPTVGMLIQRFMAEPEFVGFLKDGFRVIKYSKAWHPKFKGKGFDALLGPENNAAANVSRRLIVLARQPKQRKEGWMYLPGTAPKPAAKKKGPTPPRSRGPTPPPRSRGPTPPPRSRGPTPRGPGMSKNRAARVIQRFARRRVLPMKNAEGKFYTGFENKKPISRKYMIAIGGKLYDARNIMREVKQKYDDPHAIAMQELYNSLPLNKKIAVARRAGEYGRIFQNSNRDPKKFVNTLKSMGLPLNQVHYDNGDTALHRAILYEDVPLVKALLEAGANPNIKMAGDKNNKKSPLHLAVRERVAYPTRRLEIVNLLLRYGANPNALGSGTNKKTPLDIAAFVTKDAAVVRALLAAGAKLYHYTTSNGRLTNAPIKKAFENAGFIM